MGGSKGQKLLLQFSLQGRCILFLRLCPFPSSSVPIHQQRRMSVTQATTVDRQPIPAGITKPENYFNGKPVRCLSDLLSA